ncbi:MAG: alpha-ketoglutarate-dependent dioxygenase AlkB family protein [Acidimicrobiales bacterium]
MAGGPPRLAEPPNLLPADGEARLYDGFLSPARADRLLSALGQDLRWRQEDARLFGRGIPLPRLTAWYGDVGYQYSGVTHPPAPWPPSLDELRRLVAEVVPLPNSALANLYRSGRDSVSWHADDEPELGRQPVIASVSLGAPRRFVLRHGPTRDRVELDLPHGSLLVMAGDCQHRWQHAVPKTSRPVGPRINVTFRQMVGYGASSSTDGK